MMYVHVCVCACFGHDFGRGPSNGEGCHLVDLNGPVLLRSTAKFLGRKTMAALL